MPDSRTSQEHVRVQRRSDKIRVVVLVIGEADKSVKFSRGVYPCRDGFGVFPFPCHEPFE